MRAEEYRLALISKPKNEVSNLFTTDGIKSGHGLIKNNKFGVMNEGLRKTYPLQHSLGEFPQLPMPGFSETYTFQQLGIRF